VDAGLLQSAKQKIVVDYAFSSASLILPDIFGRLGLEVVGLNAYLARCASRNRRTIFKRARPVVQYRVDAESRCRFPDRYRRGKVFMVDEKGKRIPNETALLMVAKLVMQDRPGARSGFPVNISSVIEQLAQPNKVRIMRLRTAPRYIMEASREKGMHFVGDGIGGFIFPEFQPCFDAMFAIVKIVELMARHHAKLHALAGEVPDLKPSIKKCPVPGTAKAGDAAGD